MSAVGYNGHEFIIELDGTKIAAVRTKTSNFERSPVNVTTDDSTGWQILLPRPGTRALNIDVSGVVTAGNEELFYNISSDDFLDVTVRLPNGDSLSASEGFFLGNISNVANHDGAVEFTAQLMSSGVVTKANAAAPVNTILPAVSGIAQEGQTLTAISVWSGASSITYQWQEDDAGWANITGATGKTYVPSSGVVGNPLRVIETATNSEGSTSATSAPTAAVIGA